jgi:PAS domain-containing protein
MCARTSRFLIFIKARGNLKLSSGVASPVSDKEEVMRDTLEALCIDIAKVAEEKDHELLGHLLRVAAMEAAQNAVTLDAFQLPISKFAKSADHIIGMWDWDVTNNRNYLDARCAEYFNVDAALAEKGLPNELYGQAIHPDDIGRNIEALDIAIKCGGAYVNEFRVVQGDRVRWVHARGKVTLDGSNRPVRFPGVIVDITHERDSSSRLFRRMH